MLGLPVADVSLRGPLVIAWRSLNSSARRGNKVFVDARRAVFFQKFLDEALHLRIFTFAIVPVANLSFAIHDVLRRPGFVVERLPDVVVAVYGNRKNNIECP